MCAGVKHHIISYIKDRLIYSHIPHIHSSPTATLLFLDNYLTWSVFTKKIILKMSPFLGDYNEIENLGEYSAKRGINCVQSGLESKDSEFTRLWSLNAFCIAAMNMEAQFSPHWALLCKLWKEFWKTSRKWEMLVRVCEKITNNII